MFAITTITTLLGLLGAQLATATPVEIEKRALGVFVTTDINWGGAQWHNTELGACVNLDGNWAQKISSFGPDQGVSCRTYTGSGCIAFGSGGFKDFSYPGSSDLRQQGWNDVINSFACNRA